MLSLLTFVGVAALTVDLVVTRGAQLLAWFQGAEKTVATEVTTVINDVKKL
jgi:hypothetical protein